MWVPEHGKLLRSNGGCNSIVLKSGSAGVLKFNSIIPVNFGHGFMASEDGNK
jgi:hypothetical protein